MKKYSVIALSLIVAVWLGLTAFAWFGPRQEISEAERRPLAQMPAISTETLLNGKFMGEFEDFTLDQFPLRDSFRQLKALFSKYTLGQKDMNGIYVADGYAAELCYPLDEGSVEHALKQFQLVYDLYLQGNDRVFATVVPDKGYYLADASGRLSMDHEKLFDMVQAGMPWASFVDITGTLTLEDYYRTDTHWRQENILPVAQTLADAMGVGIATDYTVTALERPFYGVYYGQAALPMESETMYLMESDLLADCQVYLYTDDRYTSVYDMEKLSAKDPYDVFLSGAQSMIRIENPNCQSGRELVIFRDSFGSSLAPLLVQDYSAVTLIDIRYIQPQLLGKYVDFKGKDVLFMYSSLVLNKNLI